MDDILTEENLVRFTEDGTHLVVNGYLVKSHPRHVPFNMNGAWVRIVPHNRTGPAVIDKKAKLYYLEGVHFEFEDWFEKLSKEEKIEALYKPENFG